MVQAYLEKRARYERAVEDIDACIVSQYVKIYLGLPSLIVLCLMTGVAAALTPVPELSEHRKLVGYLDANISVWFRLSAVFNILLFAALTTLRFIVGEVVTDNPLKDVLLGIGGLWYLPAMMYWAILRLWIRTNRQMLQFGLVLLVLIILVFLLPEYGFAIKFRRINRILSGLWFMGLGYVLGPGFLGKAVRQSNGRMIGMIALVAALGIAHEALVQRLFRGKRVFAWYMQATAFAFNPDAANAWDISLSVRLLATLQNVLMWGLSFGMSLILLYFTARAGAWFAPRMRSLLAESSFTIYLLHFPVGTMMFARLCNPQSVDLSPWVIGLAIIYSLLLSLLFMAFTLVIRKSLFLRFLLWYKL